jgi:hypothetical protein
MGVSYQWICMEVIKTRHFFISLPLVLLALFITRNIFIFLVDDLSSLYNEVGYVGYFFIITLPAIGLQIAENKFLWGRFLVFNDNLSFFGLSVGLGIGLFSLGYW